ncbi:hypothetical protein KIPB_015134, partial [Kipferlia bialata]
TRARRVEVMSAKRKMDGIADKRRDRFNQLFELVSRDIDGVYRALTASADGVGGEAMLTCEDTEEPWAPGCLNYTPTPPLGQFREITQLSGGQRAVSSLALLLTTACASASLKGGRTAGNLIVLDEVDAALDRVHVANVGRYLRTLSVEQKACQIVCVSLTKGTY